jgi:hypothetical protein
MLSIQILIVALLLTIASVKCSFWNVNKQNKRAISPILKNNSALHEVIKTNGGSLQKQQQEQQKCDSTRDNDTDNDEEEGFVFEGKFHSQSDVMIPITAAAMSKSSSSSSSSSNDDDNDILYNFFLDPKNRDFAIKGGGNPTKCIPSTLELHKKWTTQSRIVQSTPPSDDGSNKNGSQEQKRHNEEILAVYSEVPIVPGLSLRTCSYTGCKTMIQPINNLPYYEFTLLKESYEPVGRKAMTWIFDRVTGGNNNSKNKSGNNKKITTSSSNNSASDTRSGISRETYCLSRVTLEPFPKEGGCRICYYGHVRLTLSKRFLYMLPLPKRIVQAKVNKSIKKQLQKECMRSINKLTLALNEHLLEL